MTQDRAYHASAERIASRLLALPELASVGRDSSSQSQMISGSVPSPAREAEPSAARDTFFKDQLAAAQGDPEWRAKWASALPSYPAWVVALRSCVGCMEIQEGRERGELHISQAGFRQLWDGALDASRALLSSVERPIGAEGTDAASSAQDDPISPLPNTPLSAGKEG